MRPLSGQSRGEGVRGGQPAKRYGTGAFGRTEGSKRKDPAPSRLRYRFNRWMLSPFARLFLRRGLPILTVVGALGIWLGDADRRADLTDRGVALWDQLQERPEFLVNLMAIDGASPAVDTLIRDAAQLEFPVSSFDLDLSELQEVLRNLRPVEQVHLRIRPAGILQVDVVERQPVLIWRRATGLELLDDEGVSIADAPSRALHSDLPLVAGEGVADHVDEALRIFAAARPLTGRVRGLVRVGDRRWDLVLDRGQRILLPTEQPVAALHQVVHLHQQDGLLTFDVTQVDMRLPARPTVRRAPPPVPDAEGTVPDALTVSDGGQG